MVAYTGAPDFVAIVWRWAEDTPLGFVQLRVAPTRVRFNPGASTLLSITSPIRLLRLNEKGQFKEVCAPACVTPPAHGVQWLSHSQVCTLYRSKSGLSSGTRRMSLTIFGCERALPRAPCQV